MRRRQRTPPGFVEPPARLLAFDLADWLPLVDASEYHPDDFRNIRDHVPYGPPRMSFEDWRRDRAWHLWSQARLDWCDRHGWPGGLDVVEVLQQTVQLRRARGGSPSSSPTAYP